MKNNIKELKQKALSGDLSALEELRQLGVLSGNKAKYTMAPASYAQRRLWFIDKMDHSPAYNLSAAINLEGDLNIEALENAFKEIVNRHEILRTVFVETDGTPFQKILSDYNFEISKEDLSKFTRKKEKTSLLIEKESGRCFDLSKGPLMVCSLYKLEKEKHLLLFNMHHIISDGWSIGVMISELTQLYNSFCKGGSNPLSPLKIQYKDYVKSHSDILNDSGSLVHKKFWLDKFSGELPVTELIPDFKRPLYKTFSGMLYEVVIGKPLYTGIKKLNRQSNASLFMFLLSVVNILIYKYTAKRD
ncbi:MAG: condensation domain-containing protein, partial [Candidatus Paceibacterota bacterium]